MPSAPRRRADLHQVLDRRPVKGPFADLYQSRPGNPGAALTDPATDCLQPAVSADQRLLAMVCTNGQTQSAVLAVASFYPATLSLGPSIVLVIGQCRIAFVFARRQDRRVPRPRHAGRRFPAVDGSLDPLNRADAQAGHLGPGPRRDVCTCVALVPNRSTVESENRPTVVVEFYLYARFQDRSKK